VLWVKVRGSPFWPAQVRHRYRATPADAVRVRFFGPAAGDVVEVKLDATPSHGRLSDNCFLWTARPDLADPNGLMSKGTRQADKFRAAVALATAAHEAGGAPADSDEEEPPPPPAPAPPPPRPPPPPKMPPKTLGQGARWKTMGQDAAPPKSAPPYQPGRGPLPAWATNKLDYRQDMSVSGYGGGATNPTPAPAPAPLFFEVAVPEGVAPGTVLRCRTPQGGSVDVRVPENLAPGRKLRVGYRPQAAPLQPPQPQRQPHQPQPPQPPQPQQPQQQQQQQHQVPILRWGRAHGLKDDQLPARVSRLIQGS